MNEETNISENKNITGDEGIAAALLLSGNARDYKDSNNKYVSFDEYIDFWNRFSKSKKELMNNESTFGNPTSIFELFYKGSKLTAIQILKLIEFAKMCAVAPIIILNKYSFLVVGICFLTFLMVNIACKNPYGLKVINIQVVLWPIILYIISRFTPNQTESIFVMESIPKTDIQS